MHSVRPITQGVLHTTAHTRSTCRPASLANTALHSRQPPLRQRQPHRTFLANPFSSPQTISATRILDHPSSTIYSIISDIDSYSHFLPYCQSSTVTKSSSPTGPHNKAYPEEAKLTIGLSNGVSEEFWSRVYCVPERVVEAVSGPTNTSLAADDIKHHSERPAEGQDPSRKATVLSHLLTRWTLQPFQFKPPPTHATSTDTYQKNVKETSSEPGRERTEVHLAIEFQFANPMYAALSSAAIPKVAEKLIEAFEKRVKDVVDGQKI